MKWSLSEIKKHAKTTGEIANLFDIFIQKVGFKNVRVQKWVPLELLTNQEAELHEMSNFNQADVPSVCCRKLIKQILGEVKP